MTGGAARERTTELAVTIAALLLLWLAVRVLLIAPMEATYGADAADWTGRGWFSFMMAVYFTVFLARHMTPRPGADPVRVRWSRRLVMGCIALLLVSVALSARMAITQMTR